METPRKPKNAYDSRPNLWGRGKTRLKGWNKISIIPQRCNSCWRTKWRDPSRQPRESQLKNEARDHEDSEDIQLLNS